MSTAMTAGPGPAQARGPRRWAARLMVASAALLIAGGLAVPSASADYDGLVYRGCIGELAGCTPTNPADALNQPQAVITWGSNVYAASSEKFWDGDPAGAVTHFTTSAAGDLIFDGCIGDVTGCTQLGKPFAPVSFATAGGQLYALSGAYLGAIFHFTIDPAGNLTFDDCIGSGLPGCTPITTALWIAGSLAVSPDGRQLYAGAGHAISHFSIDPAGNLTFDGCIGPLSGCTPVYPYAAVYVVHSLVVTPDGRQLYAASLSGNVVSHFVIDPAGQLGFAGCIGDAPGCTSTYPAHALDGTHAVAVSRDGAHLYAAAFRGSAISHFTIDSSGNLVFHGCIGDQAGCTGTVPVGALDGATALAMDSFDGFSLYAAAATSNAVTHFKLDSNGNLYFDGCIGNLPGCTPTGPALNFAYALAINTTGSDLYAAAINGAVSHFSIAGFGG